MITLLTLLAALAAPPQVDVSLVHASTGTPTVDARLHDIASALDTLPFDRYVLLDNDVSRTANGTPHVANLGHGIRVATTVTGTDDDSVDLTIDIFKDKDRITHTTFTQPYNRASVLAVGKEDGGVLVVPVSVRR